MALPEPPSGVTIRDATQWDVAPVAGILACTVLPTSIGTWLESDPLVRGGQLHAFYLDRVREALRHGAVRLADVAGATIGAAVWLPCTDPAADAPMAVAGAGVALRMSQMEAVVWRPHLSQPHLRLAGLGVLLHQRHHGVATALLTEHLHGLLHSARCLAVEASLTGLCARCGYRPHGEAVRLTPGGVIVQPMLRGPGGPVARARNSAAARYPSGPAPHRAAYGAAPVREATGDKP